MAGSIKTEDWEIGGWRWEESLNDDGYYDDWLLVLFHWKTE